MFPCWLNSGSGSVLSGLFCVSVSVQAGFRFCIFGFAVICVLGGDRKSDPPIVAYVVQDRVVHLIHDMTQDTRTVLGVHGSSRSPGQVYKYPFFHLLFPM